VIRITDAVYEDQYTSMIIYRLFHYYYYYYLTAFGLTLGGSSIHLHTNSTQNTEDGTHITITRKKTITRKRIIIKNNNKNKN
jgi:hypothetical protein